MSNEKQRCLVSRLTALEMAKIPHPPPSAPGQAEVLADFASKLPDLVWDYRRIDAKHIDVKGVTYDVFALQCVGDDGSWDSPTLRVELCLPCGRAACFCDYGRKAEISKHIEEVVGGSLRLWFERHQPD